MAWMYLMLTVLISCAVAQDANEDILSSGSITLPPELQQKINETEVEKIKTKYLEEFKKKCEKNGHPELYEQAQTASKDLVTCFNSLVNMDLLQQEIEDAKPNGQVDEVFKKYCNKTPQFKDCFRNMTETVKPCFSSDEKKNFKTLYNVTEQLADFICYKDGDRIALFIAEGGKECFQEKQEGIQDCFNSTFDSETQSGLQNFTVEGFMELEFKEKQCNQMTSLQTCIVGVLEKCTKPTSANIVESLFNFIRKATPCKKFTVKVQNDIHPKRQRSRHTFMQIFREQAQTATGAASGLTVTSATVLTALAAALIV